MAAGLASVISIQRSAPSPPLHHPKRKHHVFVNENPGSTRIAAGQPAGRKRLSGLKIGIAAGILAVLGAGVAVATTAANNAAPEAG